MHRHLEEALARSESGAARSHDKLEGKIERVQEEVQSARACAVRIAFLHSLKDLESEPKSYTAELCECSYVAEISLQRH